jgi:hypothetical protein
MECEYLAGWRPFRNLKNELSEGMGAGQTSSTAGSLHTIPPELRITTQGWRASIL